MNERQVANKALSLAYEWEHTAFISQESKQACGDKMKDMLRSQEKYINLLHKLCNANGIGSGKDLLTGEVIPFEVDDERK